MDKRDAASAVLIISNDRFSREVVSIGATARVREFAMRYEVSFRLESVEGDELLAEQSLELVEDYEFNQQQVLGTSSEEELIRKDMVRSMSRLILRRLELAGR
jgi:LPS-assembly lipoprotein